MSIASEITRLQNAKSALKTAIEGKGVTVPSGATLEEYPALVSGIRAPYILNPLNGTELGNSTYSGIITHQYQVSRSNIVECSLTYTTNTMWDNFHGFWNSNAQTVAKLKQLDGMGTDVTITDGGLLSINYDRSQTEVNEYNWLSKSLINVILTLEDGCSLTDFFYGWSYYSCFVKNTPITLFDGTRKPVQDVIYDDELLVWDFDNGTMSHARPLWIQSARRASEYKLVTLDDGKQLRLVGAGENCHRLFCVEDGAFVYANNMVGKTTVYENGAQHKVVSCEVVKDDVEYYNIITDYHMNLYADEVLTSCRYSNLYPIKDMVYVKDTMDIIPIDEYKVSEEYYYGMRLGESCINPKDTIAYIANLEAFRTLR